MTKQVRIVVLTGAGISAESGIRTFRATDGLWENHPVDEVATPEGFARNPKLVQRFYNERRKQLFSDQIAPNAAHFALAELEKKLGDNLLIVTQNVDNLHERAGSKNVIHMHGELLKVRCVKSGKIYDWQRDIGEHDKCPCCTPAQILRPHIVWFGEMPLEMEKFRPHFLSVIILFQLALLAMYIPQQGLYAKRCFMGLTQSSSI